MNIPDHQREEALYEQALLFSSPAEREAFLLGACAGDQELLGKVRELLTCDAEAGEQQFLPTVISPPGEQAGGMIGRYKLLQEIGEGGFGIVWMAEQMEPVSRRVALKIIKAGMDTREVIARFEAERQALAMMDHPNIAKVHDAGATGRGRPFFVMELVKGLPITQYCDEKQLGMRERLELFGDVCSAINHAHQKGVIHRDIKPSNVMVTLHGDKAVVKVIDFGVAKATLGKLTDKTLFTRFEQFIGTPVYMSPEQAALSGLDIDTRSDIYALGILLYELLTGKPPFDAKSLASAGYEEMRRIIREVEPPKPSSRLSIVIGDERTTLAKARHIEPGKLDRMVEPDLDWIVMKAIEKDRTRRYETANGLALDIQRFLADEPVSATPPSAGYKFRKFASRNKAVLRLAAGIAALLLAATGISAWQAVRATKAERLAKAEAARATTAGKLAKDRLTEVAAERDAKDAARKDAEAISTFLGEVFQSPDPARDGRTITVAETLDTAAKKLETDLSAQPGHRAKLQATLGETYRALGLYAPAVPLLEAARDYYRGALGPEHPETLMAMHALARSYWSAGRRDEALQLQKEVLTLRRKVLGPEHLDTLKAMHNLASSYADAGRWDAALKAREEVVPLSRKLNGPEHHFTLLAMTNLAISYSEVGRLAEALKIQEAVLALWRRTLGTEHPDTLRAMAALAVYYSDAGRKEEALRLEEEVLPLRRKVNGLEHPDTLNAMSNLAGSYFDAGRRDDALKLREEVLPLSRKLNGLEHPFTLRFTGHLASSYFDAGRRDDAFKLQEERLSLSRKVNGPEHPDTLNAMTDLAMSYFDAGRREEALKLREEVLALRRKVNYSEHPETLNAMQNLAVSYLDAGRWDEALKLCEEVLPLRRKVKGPEHSDTLDAMKNLAISYVEADRRDEALKLREEVLALRRKARGPEHPDTLGAMNDLAASYFEAGRLEEALKLSEVTLTLMRKVLGPEHPVTLGAMHNVASCYFGTGRRDEALNLREEVLALRRKVLGQEHPDTLDAMAFLARIYEDTGLNDEAAKLKAELGENAPSPALAKKEVKPLEAALENIRKAKGPENPDTITAMTALAAAYGADGSGRKAITLGEEALALARRVLPSGDARAIETMKTLIAIYKSVDLEDDARKLEAEMQALAKQKETDGAKPTKP